METLDFINNFLKYIFLSLLTFYIFIKISNIKGIITKKIIILVSSSIFLGLLYATLINYLSSLSCIMILYVLLTFIISYITKNKLEYSLVTTLISLAISIIGFMLAVVLISLLVKLSIITVYERNPIIIILMGTLETFFIHKFFKIKRFENGFYFLQHKNSYTNLSIVGLIFCGFVIGIFSMLRNNQNIHIIEYLFCAIILIVFGIYLWIKRNITLSYKEKMKEKTMNELKWELDEKNTIIQELHKEIDTLATINHKYNSRISATELYLTKLMAKKEFETETASELSALLDTVKSLSKEYANQLTQVKYLKELPKTNIFGIDMILQYMRDEAIKNNIEFEIKVNCSIKHMIETCIPQNRLETLLADHLKDAIIAINSSDNKHRSISLLFDIIDNCYEIRIYDSGSEFTMDTLLKLGTQRITTHKTEGGSGIGFMTTFETLQECKASLMIEEIEPNTSIYTKCISIRFDDKEEYRICSYRYQEILSKSKDNRILIENIKKSAQK